MAIVQGAAVRPRVVCCAEARGGEHNECRHPRLKVLNMPMIYNNHQSTGLQVAGSLDGEPKPPSDAWVAHLSDAQAPVRSPVPTLPTPRVDDNNTVIVELQTPANTSCR